MKSDCTVHYLLVFFLTFLSILFKKTQPNRHIYVFLYINIFRHVFYLFLVSMNLGKSLLVMGFQIMVLWYSTYPCPVLISSTTRFVSVQIISSFWLTLVHSLWVPKSAFRQSEQISGWTMALFLQCNVCPGFTLTRHESSFSRLICTEFPEIINLFILNKVWRLCSWPSWGLQ